jgi:cobyrinic acid a,c-diamide synthase
VDGAHDGIVYKNLFACYAHMRDLDNNHWTARFINFVREHRRTAGKQHAVR